MVASSCWLASSGLALAFKIKDCAKFRYSLAEISSSLQRLKKESSSWIKRVGSDKGRKKDKSNSNKCSRKKTADSDWVRTLKSGFNPATSAFSRSSMSPKAWNVEIQISVYP